LALSESVADVAIWLRAFAFVACCLFSSISHSQQAPTDTAKSHPLTAAQAAELKTYIHSAWQTLTRSQTDCKSFADPKLTTKPVLYVPADVDISTQEIETKCGIHVFKLRHPIHQLGDLKVSEVQPPGLLYLPNPYVVPGGRFNEMYGWDSYFIIRGLVHDGELDMARNMIENLFFEIEHYGAILNANRTYYLTRSQPPFLTSMIVAYYEAERAKDHADRNWLARAYGYAQRDYELWTRDPKLAGNTRLSRYYDFGDGPVPEMGDDPTYYSDVTSSLVTRYNGSDHSYLASGQDGNSAQIGPVFRVEVCAIRDAAPGPQRCAEPKDISLTPDYYKGDRAMRESGFDVSFRFGPYSGSTHHYAPVCLNSLLYKAELDLAQMATVLHKADEAAKWNQLAEQRKAAMSKYFWNEQAGMFFDYDFLHGRQSNYYYATAFYPLWAGLATPTQAQAIERNLSHFEHPGGIAMSERVTGMQWDLPYGWAPLQLIPVEGLRRYGFNEDADRVSQEFVSEVYDNFKRDQTIREKYNVVTRSTQSQVSAGYKTNVVGFGWTNGVTLVLMDSPQNHLP